MSFRRLLLLWGLVVLWMGLIFYLSSIPNLSVASGVLDFWTRKPAHIGEYTVLFLLILKAVLGSFGIEWKLWKTSVVAAVLTLLYAVSDEVHQLFVPTRAGRVMDLGFDFLGILVGFFLSYLIRLRIRRKLD